MLTSKRLQFLAQCLPSQVQLVLSETKIKRPSSSLPSPLFLELMLRVVYSELLVQTSQHNLLCSPQIRVSLHSATECSH